MCRLKASAKIRTFRVNPVRQICPVGLLLAAGWVPAFGATIDFEMINGGVPFEGMLISNQFRPYYGMSFRSPTGEFPGIARVGWPQFAFDRQGDEPSDTVRPNQTNAIGTFYLTDNTTSSNTIIIDYDAAVSQVRGYVLDVDSAETFTVLAFSDATSTNPVHSLVITPSTPNTGDGIATFWSIARPTADIRRLELICRGPMGHDLLFSSYVPPPANAAELQLRLHPGLTIHGSVGRPYRIDYADRIDRTGSSTNWHPLTTIFLPISPYLFMDSSPASSPERYYRAVALP